MSNGSKPGQDGAAKKSQAAPKHTPEHSSAAKNLLGLIPYLARYRPAIALGLLALVLTSIVGNVIPLATGVMTDILAGSARPFESNTHVKAFTGDWLSRIPFYAPHSRHALGIYCLILIVCVLLKGLMSFTTRWVLIGDSPSYKEAHKVRMDGKSMTATLASEPVTKKGEDGKDYKEVKVSDVKVEA